MSFFPLSEGQIGLGDVAVDLFFPDRRQEGAAVVNDVLEARCQVNLRRPGCREMVEGLIGQGRGAVLDRPGQTVFDPRLLGELLQGLKIELHLGDGAVRHGNAPMGRARLDADLADALQGLACLAQLLQVAFHIGLQLFGGAVLAPHLAAEMFRPTIRSCCR